MDHLIMLALISVALITLFFMLAMLILKFRHDLQTVYDKYQFERVKRLDQQRRYEMSKRK
jgi:hypothetical protein